MTVAFSVPKSHGHGSDVYQLYSGNVSEVGTAVDLIRPENWPADTSNGTYSVTISSSNYADITVTFPMTDAQRTQLENLRDQAKVLLDAAKDSNNLTQAENILKAHYDEIVALLADKDATKAAADELIDEVPGYITAVENERKPTTKPTTNKTANGEATVSYGYIAKVTVTFDSDGKVVSVVDNGTEAGGNSQYWTWATTEGHGGIAGLFKSLIGKDKDTVDSVDAVSGATVSSNAIKQAVKDALSK